VDDLDAAAFDPLGYQHVPDAARNTQDEIGALPYEPAADRKVDPPRRHHGRSASCERAREEHGLHGMAVVRMDDVPVFAEARAQLPHGPLVERRAPGRGVHPYAEITRLAGEPGGRTGEQRLPNVGASREPRHQQARLVLSASILAGGVNVQDCQRRRDHPRKLMRGRVRADPGVHF
jgi:hypothetical protein